MTRELVDGVSALLVGGATGADTAVIRDLAGHADIRTTTVYTAVSSARLVDAVDERQRQRRGVSRAAR